MNPADDHRCFHCALPIPAGSDWTATINDRLRRFCCPGCRAVAETIAQQGLGAYYRHRTAPGNRPEDDDSAPALAVYDDPDFQAGWVSKHGGRREADFAVGGLQCPACTWLIEQTLQHTPGVDTATVHLAEHRLHVRWNPSQARLSSLVAAVIALGYTLGPWEEDNRRALRRREDRNALLRLGVSGIAMMQVAIVAAALYAGDFYGMSAHWRDLLRWVSLLFATPVVTYAAAPFFSSAFQALKAGHAVMDLPVALAIGVAYAASVLATLTQAPHVYFDSVVMFTFFLTLGRYLEMRSRHKHQQAQSELHRALPWQATRLDPGETPRTVPARLLRPGDRIRVAPGDTVPADGRIISGHSTLSEAVLTGEFLPVLRGPGEIVHAGAVNQESSLTLQVTAAQADARVSVIRQTLEEAARQKPRRVRWSDRIAGYFVVGVLCLAGLTGAVWWGLDPGRAFPIVLSVLVVSCPCALSLALPTALTAAHQTLVRHGLVIVRPDTLDTLRRLTTVAFDKTGTLTEGRIRLARVHRLGEIDDTGCRQLAAALEQHTRHPIARAFADEASVPPAEDVTVTTGAGVSGTVNGHRCRIGHPGYVGLTPPTDNASLWIGLTVDDRLAAWFELTDTLRPEAPEVITALRRRGLATALLTGDHSAAGPALCRELLLDTGAYGLSPEAKQHWIHDRQRQGDIVLMIGDGVNDAPVLATADASIAMAEAADIARVEADALLLTPSLKPLLAALVLAQGTHRVIRQNTAWAIAYNLTALPLAALGWIPPWLAALGMSFSSLLVVGNAGRLARATPEDTWPASTS